MERQMEPASDRSPGKRLTAYRRGQEPCPNWEGVDCAYGAETDLDFSEEVISHPENRPLLRLCNTDQQGTVLGEVWFAPADLPAIIEFLQWLLTRNYSPSQRRWHGKDEAPALYFGEAQPESGT